MKINERKAAVKALQRMGYSKEEAENTVRTSFVYFDSALDRVSLYTNNTNNSSFANYIYENP